ncbi:prepilin-type N-terminal cleavage/methylation domain-containing protein [Jatrophihabitans sp.]|uniref:prepilin-type N-terminal cleavage/methylation domain-containing protein n=1 Tax=Jatrophihabitans sp. TaxID=1932789 RepID=UPI002CA39067|nr:type II secretion system protein [Jatrophihabitans sp.]
MTPEAGAEAASDRERGESLLELLIALSIMSIAVVAVIGGLVASIVASDIHRKQSTAGAAVRDYAETVEKYVAGAGYTACAAPSAYAPGTVGFSAPSGFTASAVTVQYWSGTAWTAGPCTELGLQRLTVQVASSDTRATEQVVLVLRKPCGQGSSC